MNSKAGAFACMLHLDNITDPALVDRMHGIKDEMGHEAQRYGRVPEVLQPDAAQERAAEIWYKPMQLHSERTIASWPASDPQEGAAKHG